MSNKYCESCGREWCRHAGMQVVCRENIELRAMLVKVISQLQLQFPKAMELPLLKQIDEMLDERGR